jgi:hypothetical protein
MKLLCWVMASPYFEVQEPLQICTLCFHRSETWPPHLEFCYAMSMVCAMIACYVLESSECGNSGQFHQGLGVQLVRFPITKPY